MHDCMTAQLHDRMTAKLQTKTVKLQNFFPQDYLILVYVNVRITLSPFTIFSTYLSGDTISPSPLYIALSGWYMSPPKTYEYFVFEVNPEGTHKHIRIFCHIGYHNPIQFIVISG